MTKLISGAIVIYWRVLPIVLAIALWVFFAGTKKIRKLRRRRFVREALLLGTVFGFLTALACFGCYGLVDPANGLVHAGAVPVTAADLTRFAIFGYGTFSLSLVAGAALEWDLRRG